MSLFFVSKAYSQSAENISIYLEKQNFIEEYVFIELSIYNRNPETIYVLKDYVIDEIIETNETIKFLIKSSWLSSCLGYDENGDLIWISSAIHHNPSMIEIRNNQSTYVSLLLKIPDKHSDSYKNKIITEIDGIKFSFHEYITEDISHAENVIGFYNEILKKLNDLKYIEIKYFMDDYDQLLD
jgi:hypothetical protein